MDYLASLFILICVYTILTASLDLLIGYTGLLSFGHAAFIGVGSYAAALGATQLGLGFFPALVLACALSAATALLLALPILRLTGDYFVLGTFGFSMVASSVFENWVEVTNGPYGIFGIPRVNLLGWSVRSSIAFLALTIAATALVLFIKRRLVTAPYGLILSAIREDETVALVLGKPVTRIKVIVFAISGAACGLAGTILAYDLHFIDPTLFAFPVTVFIWAALFVGGCASTWGNLVGPAILVLFPEALRFVGLTGGNVGNMQQALYGLLLVTIVLFRPQGIAGGYRVR